MILTSHGAFGWRLTRDPVFTVGAVAPDLPALAFALYEIASRTPRDKVLWRAYRLPNRRKTHLTAHSLLSSAAVAALGGRRARRLAAGWLAHQLIDYALHHTDAWPPFWPLWNRRWPSPVSYWQLEHHARPFQIGESTALAVLAARSGGLERAALLGAVAFAALPLLHDNPHGLPGFAGLKPRTPRPPA